MACDSHSIGCYQLEPAPDFECLARADHSGWDVIEGGGGHVFEVGEDAVLMQRDGEWNLVFSAMNRELLRVRFGESERGSFVRVVSECGVRELSVVECDGAGR